MNHSDCDVTILLLLISMLKCETSIFIICLRHGSKFYHGIQGVLATYHTQLETSRTGLSVDGHLCLYELGGQHENVNLRWHLVFQSVFLYVCVHTFNRVYLPFDEIHDVLFKEKIKIDRNVHWWLLPPVDFTIAGKSVAYAWHGKLKCVAIKC